MSLPSMHCSTRSAEGAKTDMTLEDMEDFIKLARTLDTENISSVVIDAWKKESLLRVSHVQVEACGGLHLGATRRELVEIHDVSERRSPPRRTSGPP